MSALIFLKTKLGRAILAVILAVAFIGIGHLWHESNEKKNQRAESARAERAVEIQNARGVRVVASYPGPGGQIEVLDVTAASPYFSGRNERRRCFLWRGAGGDSLSCSSTDHFSVD